MKPGKTGFSLIELMAAVAVLAILGLILSQITGSIVRTTKLSTHAIDAAGQARIAFDRLSLDLAGLIKRKDTDFAGQNYPSAGTDPVLLFLSQVSSSGLPSSNNRTLSMVAYGLRAHPDNKDSSGVARPCLVRAGKAIPWSASGSTPAAGFMGLQAGGFPQTFSGGASTFPSALLPGGIQDFDVLAAGAIRMVVAFQLYPDNQRAQLADNTAIANAQGQIVYSPPTRTVTSNTGTTAQVVDLTRVSALMVGLVVVDLENLRLVSAAQAAALGNAFPTPADTDDKTPLQAWAAKANAPASLPGGIPLPVRQAVRVYERAYPITPFPTQGP